MNFNGIAQTKNKGFWILTLVSFEISVFSYFFLKIYTMRGV